LIVITEDKGIGKAIRNLIGCNVCRVENLSVAYLAPGAMPGRLTIFTESAVKKLGG
jgi:large subunit ribosomal protein L4e